MYGGIYFNIMIKNIISAKIRKLYSYYNCSFEMVDDVLMIDIIVQVDNEIKNYLMECVCNHITYEKYLNDNIHRITDEKNGLCILRDYETTSDNIIKTKDLITQVTNLIGTEIEAAIKNHKYDGPKSCHI